MAHEGSWANDYILKIHNFWILYISDMGTCWCSMMYFEKRWRYKIITNLDNNKSAKSGIGPLNKLKENKPILNEYIH